MENPFYELSLQLKELSEKIDALSALKAPAKPIEIIDRDELCKRLAITEPTVIRHEKKGKIPCIRIGSNCRYNWPAVVEALESGGKHGK